MEIPSGALVGFFDERDDNDSMLIGGYYIPRKRLSELDMLLREIKAEYSIPESAPIKWNLRDPSCSRARIALGRQVDEFRIALFNRLAPLEIHLIASLVWKGDPSYKIESWKWSFENVLQRLCIILDRKKSELDRNHDYPFLDVVFDWLPSSNRIDEYFMVYSQAFHEGYQFTDNKLPALKDCEACPCLLVTSTRHSFALQICDMILGAIGDFFTWIYKNERESSVNKYFIPLYKLFHRGNDNSVLGKGIIVKGNTKARVSSALSDLGLMP